MYADYDVIKHMTLGAIVIPIAYNETKREIKEEMFTNSTVLDIGHITGFETNATMEVVVKVKLASGRVGLYHPNNLMVL